METRHHQSDAFFNNRVVHSFIIFAILKFCHSEIFLKTSNCIKNGQNWSKIELNGQNKPKLGGFPSANDIAKDIAKDDANDIANDIAKNNAK